MQLRDVNRKQVKIRLGIAAVSGGGKTYGALLVAKGLAGGDMTKVALIDTEHGSGDFYEALGKYKVLPLEAPFTPERYVQAINICIEAGMEVIIVDGISQEWEGSGGILEDKDNSTGNSFTAWKTLTPRHQKLVTAVLKSPIHMITTVRRKQEYMLITNDKGKQEPVKVGLKEITRDGYEYELTINMELDLAHQVTVSKDRTSLFDGQGSFVLTEETGAAILEWCKTGTPMHTAEEKLKMATTLQELAEVYTSLSIPEKKRTLALKEEMKEKLSLPASEETAVEETAAETTEEEPLAMPLGEQNETQPGDTATESTVSDTKTKKTRTNTKKD